MLLIFLSLCYLVPLGFTEPVVLTKADFASSIQSGNAYFVKFYAPWCGHCKRLAPTWDDLSKEYEDDSTVVIARVDCTQETQLCSEHGVKGYPTLKLFKGQHVVPYTGQRDLKALKDFVVQQSSKMEGDDLTVVGAETDQDGQEDAGKESFELFLEKEGIHFVKFYAPWCGHCQKLAPVWEELMSYYNDNPQVHVGRVDCTKNGEICSKYGVQGYPTLILFEDGIAIDKYKGERTLNALVDYVTENTPPSATESQEAKEEKGKTPVELTTDTFAKTIDEGVTFVKFYAPWCGHCKRLAPTWDQLAELAHATTHTTIAKVDCTVEKTVCGKYNVRGYPTLILFSEGQQKEEYKKARDLDSLVAFLKEHDS